MLLTARPLPMRLRRRGCAQPPCVAALRLEPVGERTTDHLPPAQQAACVPPGPVTLPKRGGAVVLGRDSLGAVPTVNTEHARVEVTRTGEVYVTDLGSKNGTTLGGRALLSGRRRQLLAGEELVLGDPYLCKFCLVDEDHESLAPAADAPAAVPAAEPALMRQEPAAPVDARAAVVDVDASQPSGADAARAEADAARAVSAQAVADLEQDVGSSVEVWKARVSAQAAAAAGAAPAAAPPSRVTAGAWSGKGLLGGFSALISNSNVLIQNSVSVSVNVGAAGAPAMAEAKAALVRALLGVDGGARANTQQRGRIEALCRSLEAVTPAAAPLRSPLLNGRWQLQYTTDATVLGTGRLPGLRPVSICFTLDVFALKMLREDEFAPLPFLRWTSASVADVLPRSDTRAALRFRGLRIGGMDLPAPPRTPGRAAMAAEAALLGGAADEAWIQVTYLDYDLLVQRTSAGHVAVLTRVD